jgi:hypothetical protein
VAAVARRRVRSVRFLRGLAVGGIVALAAAGIASAAAIPATVRSLGAGSAAVSPCDADGFTYSYTVNTSGNITSVTVAGIASACAGGTLRLTLTSGTTSVGSGSSALPSVGFTGSASVTLSPAPASSQVTAAYAAVEGP